MARGETSGVTRNRRMHSAWLAELRRLLLSLALGWLLGWALSAPHLGMAGALLLLMGFHLRQLYCLARWSQQPQRSELPDTAGIWGVIFDALYETQRRARERKRKLASILSEFQASTAALPDGAIVVSPRGEIAWFNSAAQTLLGLRSPQDIGNRVNNLIRDPTFSRYVDGRDYAEDLHLPSPMDPQTTLSLRLIPYGNGQRLLIARDVSESRRLDRMRRDFVANASHELRTPLTVLAGYVDMMRPDSAKPDGPLAMWAAPLEEMRRQLTRMEMLLEDLLKLARLEAETPAPRGEVVDMPEVIESSVSEARQLSAGGHRIDAEIDSGLMLAGRQSELHSIVGNLLSNAVRYTPEGGNIHLNWRREAGDEAVLRVSDSGIGIDPEVIPRLTERFYRVDVGRSRASGGTGLGLAIVKHALEHHEAVLDVESAPGQGSSFICRFPAYRAQLGVSRGRTADRG